MTSAEAQKPWQHGYDFGYLKSIEARFADYNRYALGPSGQNGPTCGSYQAMRKDFIAQALHDKTLQIFDWGVVDTEIVRVSTPIKAYLDVILARKQTGDRVVHAFTWDNPTEMTDYLSSFDEPTWMWIWQECREQKQMVCDAGYEFVGSKITSFAEIRGLYFRDAHDSLFPRQHPALDPAELIGIQRTPITVDVDAALCELETIELDYTIHYSNYQTGESWSALSLRGYTGDPRFITKPAEMNKKWREQHANEHFELQDTPLRTRLSAVDELCAPLTRLSSTHRIRLMRLTPGGGELRRHTDLVDKDSGISDGNIARFHFPLITNPGVEFSSWDMMGEQHRVCMEVGSCWYLDTRKPHRAINQGSSDRIHLVVDVESNNKIRKLLTC